MITSMFAYLSRNDEGNGLDRGAVDFIGTSNLTVRDI